MTAGLLAVLASAAVFCWPAKGSATRRVVRRLGVTALDGRQDGVPALIGGADGTETGRRARVVDRIRQWTRRLRGGPTDHGSGLNAAELLSVVEHLGTALRAGLATATALDVVSRHAQLSAPARRAMSQLAAASRAGESLADIWPRHTQTGAGARLLSQAWQISEHSGAPLADALASVARIMRTHIAEQRQIEATLAQARATMTILSLLPLGGPILALAVGVDPVALAGSRLSLISMGTGAGLLVLGRRWVRAQIRHAVRAPVLR